LISKVRRIGTENVCSFCCGKTTLTEQRGEVMSWTINRPIIVPFDFSDYALQAVRKAIEVAGNSSLITCLHVLPFITPTEPGVAWGMIDDGERLRQALESMHQQLPESEFGRLQVEVRFGDPGSIVADRAKELDAELIVIGSHGRSGIVRLMLGSVAEHVTRLAPCPVLVVKLQPHPVESPEPSQSQTPQVAIA
jgi:nucleotide-binding universal stress UspA family protein